MSDDEVEMSLRLKKCVLKWTFSCILSKFSIFYVTFVYKLRISSGLHVVKKHFKRHSVWKSEREPSKVSIQQHWVWLPWLVSALSPFALQDKSKRHKDCRFRLDVYPLWIQLILSQNDLYSLFKMKTVLKYLKSMKS